MPPWSAGQYLKFSEERTRTCRDLAARILVAPVRRVIDLGCGPGNSTEVLAGIWPEAEITGLDNSAEMIEDARRNHPNWHWIAADVSTWASKSTDQFDVICSNAALQWVEEHDVIYPRLLSRVAAGGALAVQLPNNFDGPGNRFMRDVAASPV